MTIPQILALANSFTELCNMLRENGVILPNRWLHRLWQEELQERKEDSVPDFANAVQRMVLHQQLTFNPDTGEIIVR